jgi:uncharacterized protein (TIGR02265 family)
MDTRVDLLRRLALALPEECTYGQFLEDTLKGLEQLYGSRVAEHARASRISYPGQSEQAIFSCPLRELLRVTDAGANAVEQWGLGSYSRVLEEMGAFIGDSYLRSPVGQAFRRLTSGDVVKTVEMSIAATRAVATYGQRRFEKTGPTTARLILQRELMGPLWIESIYTKVFRAVSGVSSLSCEIKDVRTSGMDFYLLYTWTEP